MNNLNVSPVFNGEIFHSNLDSSVNWVVKADVGYFESRYVRREKDYFVIYLSSQSGCNQACRMCHLTASGQTSFIDASVEDIVQQAEYVFEWYDRACDESSVVHFNFMARGEPLNNPNIVENSHILFSRLADLAQIRNLKPKFLVSTIMPSTLKGLSLEDIFPVLHPEIYYSLYSVEDKFRKRWLPRAEPVSVALERLVSWQRHTSKIPKIHFAFIEGENDNIESVVNLCETIKNLDLRVNFNIVRYNPPEHKAQSSESREEVIQRNIEIIGDHFPDSRIKLHPRVGMDVNASCGMFTGPSRG